MAERFDRWSTSTKSRVAVRHGSSCLSLGRCRSHDLLRKQPLFSPLATDRPDASDSDYRRGASSLQPLAQRVLTLLHAYPLVDVIAAISRSIQYHAYGFHSLERILAHFGTPRNSWESLTEHEQQMLKQITESDPIGPRRSEEYQQLLDEVTTTTDEAPQQANPEQNKCTGTQADSGDEPPRQDPPASGRPETEDASGSDRSDRS